MKRFMVFFLLIAVLLVGCSPRKPMDTETTNVPSADEVETVIVYTRSGGLQGKSETWTIYPDGRIFPTSGSEWTVEPSLVEALLATMDEAGFYEKTGNYATISQCRDCYKYTVTVEKGDLAYTVTTEDSDEDTPEEIWDILEQIKKIVTSK